MNAKLSSHTEGPTREIAAGITLVVCAVLSVFVLSHHPAVKMQGSGEIFGRIAQITFADRLVHGLVILFTIGLLFSLCVFSRRQGIHRGTVLLALIFYAFGAGALIAASLVDGFFVPAIGAMYQGASRTEVEAGIALLRFCSIAIQVFTKFGLIASTVAILLWSASFARAGHAPLYVAIIGAAVAISQVYFLLSTGPSITAQTIVIIVGAQMVWYFAVGILLIRGDL